MQYENEKVVTRIRNRLGKNQHSIDTSAMSEAEENNVSAATVQKYAIFTRALEEIGKKEPKLVPKILSGQYKIAHKHVMEMAELPAQDLRRINRKIERNPAEFMQYKATRPVVQGGRFEAVPGDLQAAPSVKDICGFLSRFHTLLCNSGFPDGLQHLLTDVGIEGSEKLVVILT